MSFLDDVVEAFPDLQEVKPLGVVSGQKDVFRARLGEKAVVLKVVKPSKDEELSEGRLEREVAAVASLRSDFVPTVHRQGKRTVGGQERVFLIEDLVEGTSLREALIDRRFSGDEVLDMVHALLLACRDFEQQKLVHRDIKPENLILDPDGKLWVIDFGLVRFLEQESLTATSAHFGPFTPGYGAPEQMRNRKQEIDVRADLFAVGIVAHELFTGANHHWRDRNPLSAMRSVENTALPRLKVPGDRDGKLAELIASLASRYITRRPLNAVEALEWFTEVRAQMNIDHGNPEEA